MNGEIEFPRENLELFDSLDLDKMAERRAATRAITDFYGSVLSRVGTSYLEFTADDLTQGIGPLWRKARGRFRGVEDIDVPDEYDSLLNRLHNCQNDIDHDFQENPEQAVLEEARRDAEEWARWFRREAKTYEEAVGQQSAQETMIRLARQSLNLVQQSPDSVEYDDLIDHQEELNKEASNRLDEIDEIEDNTDTITNGLVFILSDSINLEQEHNTLLKKYHQRKERELREHERDYNNTTAYYVTDPYDEDDPGKGVIMVSDEVGREDRTISVNPHHPDIPDDTRERLTSLSTNTRYLITFGYDENRTRYVKNIRRG